MLLLKKNIQIYIYSVFLKRSTVLSQKRIHVPDFITLLKEKLFFPKNKRRCECLLIWFYRMILFLLKLSMLYIIQNLIEEYNKKISEQNEYINN